MLILKTRNPYLICQIKFNKWFGSKIRFSIGFVCTPIELPIWAEMNGVGCEENWPMQSDQFRPIQNLLQLREAKCANGNLAI